MLAIDLRTCEENLFATLLLNAISDHYLQDSFAPGHIATLRVRLTDLAATAYHDKRNRRGLDVTVPADRLQAFPVFALRDGGKGDLNQAVLAALDEESAANLFFSCARPAPTARAHARATRGRGITTMKIHSRARNHRTSWRKRVRYDISFSDRNFDSELRSTASRYDAIGRIVGVNIGLNSMTFGDTHDRVLLGLETVVFGMPLPSKGNPNDAVLAGIEAFYDGGRTSVALTGLEVAIFPETEFAISLPSCAPARRAIAPVPRRRPHPTVPAWRRTSASRGAGRARPAPRPRCGRETR